MTATISRLYNSYADAKEAVRNLEAAGVPHNDISIIASNADNWYSSDRTGEQGTFPDRDLDGRMTALRQQAPAPASVRPWAARRACSQGLAYWLFPASVRWSPLDGWCQH